MFVHWGHSSQRGCELSLGRLRWCILVCPAVKTNIPVNITLIKPTLTRKLRLYEWAHQAKRLGIQYAIFDDCHHDGFAMFHTRNSQTFSIQHLSPQRHMGNLLMPCDRLDCIGLYFSLIDWHHPITLLKPISLTLLVSFNSLRPNNGSGLLPIHAWTSARTATN